MPSNLISTISALLPGYLWPWAFGVLGLCLVAGLAFAFRGKGDKPPAASKMSDTDETKPEKEPSKFFTRYYGTAFFFMIAAFAAAAILIIRPMIQDIRTTDAQIAAQEQTLKNTSLALSVLDQSVSAAQSIPADTLASVSLALPTDPGYPYILADLSAAAARNGARLSTVSFSPPTIGTAQPSTDVSQGTVLPVVVQVSLSSSGYFDLKNFLADIESSLRLMDVTGIALSADPTGAFSYTMQLQAYVFVPPGGVAPGAPST